MKINYFLIIFLILIFSCESTEKKQFPLQFVDPFVGTGGHGHTFPGATLPFGMVQLSPDTRLTGWDGCSGYHYSDSVIYGFSHTHLQGTGISDYGDILLMPGIGDIQLENGSEKGSKNGYSSTFKKDSEKASPGYYSVRLDEPNVDVELTATRRTGIHHYRQKDGEPLNIVIDLNHRDQVNDATMRIVNKYEIEGHRISSAWAQDQRVYFVIQFDQPITDHIESDMKNSVFPSDSVINFPGLVCGLHFETSELNVKVGISPVSIDGARQNLNEEAPHWDFENYKRDAEDAWLKELGKIKVSDKDSEKLTNFYTALYHSFVAPNTFTDVDGRYRGTDKEIHSATDHEQYTVFSLWDTFRATHPLYTMVQRERTEDFINTFLKMYKQGGQLPVWELAGNYTGCMIGYHSVPVIVDAYFKGITDFDEDLALEAMIQAADSAHLGKEAFAKGGYIPSDLEHESVSKTLEYAYDDWCIAQFAKAIGRDSVYNRFIERAQYYKNIFDRKSGFMRPRKNGAFITPFDPAEVNFHFTEANSYQYSWFVPQDITGLIDLHGGEKQFNQRLDTLFNTSRVLSGRGQPDITGLIGQYAHGNEPSHHISYLYNYSGEPWKTQKMVSTILDEMYAPLPDGLSGNEDCGQMSSWYVLSALGFYPVTPGQDCYTFGCPQFEKVEIQLENGETFTIESNQDAADFHFIQSVTLNGKSHKQNFITDSIIQQGGSLVFDMGKEPNKSFGSNSADRPRSEISERLISPVPVLDQDKAVFTDSISFGAYAADTSADIFLEIHPLGEHSASGNYPKTHQVIGNEMFTISEDAEIHFWSEREGLVSLPEARAKLIKLDSKISIELLTDYDPQYTAGGSIGLIDGILGGKEFKTGGWQGYQGKDLEAILDLGKLQEVSEVKIRCLQNTSPWIWLPTEVTVETSDDGVEFTTAGRVSHEISPRDEKAIIHTFTIPVNESTRFLKVTANAFGEIPKWHIAAGNDSWLFVDEIIIE